MPLTDEDINEMDDILGVRKVNPKPQINIAAFSDPDKQAEIITLSESRKLPMDTVERNLPELQGRERADSINTDGYPKLSEYFAEDEKNTKVSIDDLDSLKGLEDAIKRSETNIFERTGRSVLETVNSLTGNFLQGIGNIDKSINGILQDMGIPNPGIQIGEDGISFGMIPRDATMLLEETGRAISEGKAYDYQPGFTWERLKGDITVENIVGTAFEQGVPSIAHMAAAIYTLPAYLLSRTEEIAEQRVANDERQDVTGKDLAKSFIPAATVALIERFAGKVTLGVGGVKTAKDAFRATGTASAIEGATEFIQEGVEYLGETLGTKKKLSAAEMIDRQLAGLFLGGSMGAGIRGTTSTIEAVSSKVARNTQNTISSNYEQETISDIVSFAQSSKTRERKLDRFKIFMQKVKGEKQIHISTEAISEAMGKGLEMPVYIINQLDGLGADVTIDMEQFSSDIAPNEEIMAVFRPHIKMSPGTLTQSEMEVEEDLSIKALLEKAEQSQELKTESEEIYESVKEQLVATGRQSEITARYSAAIIPAYAATKSEQTGKSVKQIYEAMGLTIVGPEAVIEEDGVVLEETETGVSYKQNFGDIVFKDKKILKTTGKPVNIEQSAQQVWDRNIKRKDQAMRLRDCINV